MRLFLRSADRRPDPPPLRTNDRAAVLTGMGVWAVLLLVALVLRSRLVEQGRGWWVWTPVAALVLGALGLLYLHRRDRRDSGARAPRDGARAPRDGARAPRDGARAPRDRRR